MRWESIVLSALFAVLAFAQPKPEKLPISTWVREDLFAGFMANDAERFEIGVKKLDVYQAEHPDDASAVAWRGLSEAVRAVRAHESGHEKDFIRFYDRALTTFERAKSTGTNRDAVYAIAGGTWIALADRLPEPLRKDAYQRAYDDLLVLKKGQSEYFDHLPPHMKGEVLAGLAQSAQRLGKKDEERLYLAQIVASVPDTPYANRAKKWMDGAEKGTIACQTCHDAGRLENVMARAAKQN